MPAIQVARTDTFENQRQKINQIGAALFNITQGGSDLSTGNLKLGDGTRLTPSLAFISESDLGFYKPTLSTLGVVSQGKKTIDFTNTGTYSFKDILVERRKLSSTSSSFTLVNSGTGYGAGIYTDIPLVGGTGSGATGDFTVVQYSGQITSSGRGYKEGQYTGIGLDGGSGSGAAASFIVRGITGTILNEGTGYVPGTYNDVPLTGGNGSGCQATIFVASPGAGTPGGNITSVTISSNGNNNYNTGDILSVNNSSLGGSGSGFQFEIISENPGQVSLFTFTDRGDNYDTNDVLVLPGVKTGVTTNLKGEVLNLPATLSTSSTTVTLSSTTGIIPGMSVFSNQGDPGSVLFGTTVVSVTPTQVVLSQNPVGSGATTLTFRSSGTLTEIVVNSLDGIFINSIVTQTSGTGQLANNTTVSSINTNTNTVTLSATPLLAGTATLSFTPSFGTPVQSFSYTVGNLGTVDTFSVSTGGNGYSVADELNVNPSDLSQPITYFVKNISVQKLYFSSVISSAFDVGDTIKEVDGALVNVSLLNSTTIAGQESQTYTAVASTTNGSGTGATFTVIRGTFGDVVTVLITPGSAGLKYKSGDIITIAGNLVGGSTPADNVTLTVVSASANLEYTVYKKVLDGPNIDYIIVETDQLNLFETGQEIVKNNDYTSTYLLSAASDWSFRYLIDLDDGNGYQLTPSWDVYVGDTYLFDLSDSSNTSHVFALSEYRDGIWGPSYIQNVSTTLSISSTTITISDTTNILPGMNVTQSSGNGTIANNTKVLSVPNSTTVILDQAPIQDGSAVLNFRGFTYTDGVTTGVGSLTLKVTENTPSLYYFCDFNNIAHVDEGGEDFEEALITVEQNNPRTFGSGFEILINSIESENVITLDIEDGSVTALEFYGDMAEFDNAVIAQSLSSQSVSTNTLITSAINSPTSITVQSPSTTISGAFNVSTFLSVNGSNGNLTTSGILKTSNSLNVNDILTISNNTITVVGDNNIVLTPPIGKTVKVNNTTALTIPAGTTSQRPTLSNAESGSIRFNTETNQYEGYSSSTSNWSSLGGVRDLDGNTYILAEQTVGSNDNTLWFFNDNKNTVKFTPQYQEFVEVKKIRSVNTTAPSYVEWTSNTPVVSGQYLKYRNNIFEVVTSGTTATSGNEPTNTTGNDFANGSATLKFFVTAVAPLTFEEISEIRFAPLGGTPVVVNSELRFSDNKISTDLNDLIIKPNNGKKVVIDSTTHFAIPAGNDNQKSTATAQAGSIRYNTTISQFEGYSGSNWSSLGGVRDVDGNTYIIPETAPGANENILYFYNDNLNTVQLSKTTLDFTNIDTITTSGLGTLALDTPLVTLNLDDTTIDNRDVTRTFISTSKQYLDLGLSSGLVVDPVLRLDDQGDVYLNTGFGTGSFVGVKIFDGDLKEFELADYAVKTSTFSMEKGNSSTTAVLLYSLTLAKGCQVSVMSKSSAGKKSLATYNIIDNGSDIFHNEFGSLNTSADGFSATFDITPEGETRITLALSNDHANGDIVEFTVITQVYK